ncbi:MAG TPA: hypothetical protein VGR37_21135 [Longimicrobiaceae bacterium]|nr:hypothetical protein [Longimicrobiaceae bacterium]
MHGRRALVLMAALVLAACGGDDGETAADTQELPPGTVDTAGVGVDTPTAGGQLVDTAAVPGPVDTVEGTPTAP